MIIHSHRQNCHELAKPLACQEAVNCALSSSSGYLLARKIKAETSKTLRVEVTKRHSIVTLCMCIVNSEQPGKADYLDK